MAPSFHCGASNPLATAELALGGLGGSGGRRDSGFPLIRKDHYQEHQNHKRAPSEYRDRKAIPRRHRRTPKSQTVYRMEKCFSILQNVVSNPTGCAY